MDALADYYAKRAPEYERIYKKPERQADLRTLREFFPSIPPNKRTPEGFSLSSRGLSEERAQPPERQK